MNDAAFAATAEAYALLRRAADAHGDADALYVLADLHLRGDVPAATDAAATERPPTAAGTGLRGRTRPPDARAAARLYRAACALGHADACCCLGALLHRGFGAGAGAGAGGAAAGRVAARSQTTPRFPVQRSSDPQRSPLSREYTCLLAHPHSLAER